MQIRKIKVEHFDQLYSLSKLIFKEESWSKDQLREAIEDDNYLCISLMDEGKILAFLIAVQSLDDINIVSVATHSNNKKKGYATRLLNWMINLAKYVEKTLSLEVKSKNEVAIKLYEKLGFVKVHERPRYYRDGDTALIMFLGDTK